MATGWMKVLLYALNEELSVPGWLQETLGCDVCCATDEVVGCAVADSSPFADCCGLCCVATDMVGCVRFGCPFVDCIKVGRTHLIASCPGLESSGLDDDITTGT